MSHVYTLPTGAGPVLRVAAAGQPDTFMELDQVILASVIVGHAALATQTIHSVLKQDTGGAIYIYIYIHIYIYIYIYIEREREREIARGQGAQGSPRLRSEAGACGGWNAGALERRRLREGGRQASLTDAREGLETLGCLASRNRNLTST